MCVLGPQAPAELPSVAISLAIRKHRASWSVVLWAAVGAEPLSACFCCCSASRSSSQTSSLRADESLTGSQSRFLCCLRGN